MGAGGSNWKRVLARRDPGIQAPRTRTLSMDLV